MISPLMSLELPCLIEKLQFELKNPFSVSGVQLEHYPVLQSLLGKGLPSSTAKTAS